MSGRILITGANGYLGAHCVERCASTSEREVVAVWHAGSDRLLATPPSNIHYERCDVTNQAEIDELFRRWKIDKVIHTAALPPDGQPGYIRRAVLSNILATANLVERAADSGCTRFVYCSSTSVYGAAPCPEGGWEEDGQVLPSSVYGWTKHAGEECVRLPSGLGGLTGVSLRLAGIHGRGRRGGVAFHMIRAALAGQPLIVNNPTNRFQLLFLDDAVDAVLLALEPPLPNSYHCFNVASHVFPSLIQMAESIIATCGSKSVIQIGTTGADMDQVMNTVRMRTSLGLAPDGIEPHLRQIRDSLEGTQSRYA
jgi:nucleoside-diphosphate-sugar epimerase